LAAKIQQQITQDYAQHFLFAPNYYVVVRDGLQGVSPGPYAPVTWNAVEWFWRE
jgi:ABC-type transport system substrate-binding protein